VLLSVSVRYWRGCKKLRPEDLDITVEVTPAHPSSLVDDGHIVMVVSAANRSGKPADVNLGPSNSGIAFSFQLTSDNGFFWWGGVPVTAPETTRFAAGEKQRSAVHVGEVWLRVRLSFGKTYKASCGNDCSFEPCSRED